MLWRPFIERKCNVRCVRNTRWHVDGWRALKSLQLAAIKKPLQESHGICSKIFRLNCFASHSQHFPPLRSFRQSSESVDTGRSDLQRYNTAVDRVPASQTSTNLPSVTLLYIYIYIFCSSCATSVMPKHTATSLLQWFCQRTIATRCPCPKSCQCWRLPVSTSLTKTGSHQMSTSCFCPWMIAAVMCTASSRPSTPTPRAHTCSSDPPANMLSVSTSSPFFQFSPSLSS